MENKKNIVLNYVDKINFNNEHFKSLLELLFKIIQDLESPGSFQHKNKILGQFYVILNALISENESLNKNNNDLYNLLFEENGDNKKC